MADFCKDCSIETFGVDTKDLAGLCKPGYMASALCEGCGFIWVDENGKRIDEQVSAFPENKDK